MEVDHAIAVDVHLRMQGANEAWGHWLGRGFSHALDRLILRNLILPLLRRLIPLSEPDVQLLAVLTFIAVALILRQVVDS